MANNNLFRSCGVRSARRRRARRGRARRGRARADRARSPPPVALSPPPRRGDRGVRGRFSASAYHARDARALNVWTYDFHLRWLPEQTGS